MRDLSYSYLPFYFRDSKFKKKQYDTLELEEMLKNPKVLEEIERVKLELKGQ